MNRTLLRCLAATALILGGIAASAQQQPMSSQRLEFNASSLNGLAVHGEARGVEGLDYSAAVSITVFEHRSVLHRLFMDRNHHVYFGYDLEAYLVEGSTDVHLRFRPLSSLSSFAGIDISGYQPRQMVVPAEQTVPANTSFEVPLEIDAAGGRVLRDKLTFSAPSGQ